MAVSSSSFPRAVIAAVTLIHFSCALDSASFQVTNNVLQQLPISPRFVGFSIEVGSTPSVLGVGGLSGPPRASFGRLMNLLRANGTRGPNLRIGGNSADESAYVPDTANPLPANSTYRITDADLMLLASSLATFNGTAVIDVTMRYGDNASLSVAHAAAAGRILGWDAIEGVEVGNEVDLFHENGIRKPTYSYADYRQEFGVYRTSLASVIPTPRIQGATWCSSNFVPDWSDYVATYAPSLSSLSYHRYGVSGCGTSVPTITALLNDSSSAHIGDFLAPLAKTAAASRIPFYVGEGNSASCGGKTGVSDVFAAALWAVDVLFNAAAAGAQRWNFHGGPRGPYAPLVYADASVDTVEVRPLFYALWAFSNVTANDAVLHVIRTNANSNNYIKAWSCKDSLGFTRVVIVHKDPTASGNATITIEPPSRLNGIAQLTRLTAG